MNAKPNKPKQFRRKRFTRFRLNEHPSIQRCKRRQLRLKREAERRREDIKF